MIGTVGFAAPVVIGLLLFAVVLITLEVGYRAGTGFGALGQDGGPNVGAVESAVLGLVALLLAFMFSFGASRYDLRRALLVREANDIGTTYLRAGLLHQPYASELRDALRSYLDIRLAFYDGASDPAIRPSIQVRSDELQRRLWGVTEQAVSTDSRPIVSIFVQSLNETIDVSAEQRDAFRNVLPGSILFLLLIAAAIAGLVVGFGAGRSGSRNLPYSLAFALLIAAVAFTIVDLDRPSQGLIRISDAPLRDLRAEISRPALPSH